MKNILIVASLLFLVACGGESKEERNINKLIEANDFEALEVERSALLQKVSELETLLDKINASLSEVSKEKKLPLVTVFEVKEEEFKHYVELQGSVETDQNILVYPEIQGNLISFKANMGDQVKKGDIIAVIDDGGLRQQLAQLEEQTALSKITYERQKRLWDQKIGSELDYLRSETAYNSNVEAVNQAKKQLAKATITAPFNGQIDETFVNEGQVLVPGQTPLFRIISLDKMYIHSDVPEKYLSSIKKGKKVEIELAVLDTAIQSTIGKVSNYINPDNRTFKIEVQVPNKEGLIKPNLTARLQVNDYINENAILIPQSIISEDSEGRQYIYLTKKLSASANPMVQKVFITTGKKKGDYIEVLNGLKVGDSIIKDGARLVKDQQEVQIIK
jgi:RND family efflux transporter MFP subunit